ncbi:MAG: 50S ribosomal protein L29 [candidate division Zixibacteria bacterium]|nr:50S ribosomal protein L29 [candidate division Zixibacteria bacterium]NIR67696.1 50S ribosomal protein L29 [candidate division Zixibacteria bacterium]NIS16762.1 50S ribosomal protein L29 [candidate division Zixibacteria bacterium]NIS48949.1 50S ribosomal protein L29 [candidate division Zixibacteria bacterium]NIT53165.1 50S ribosomal protein L29 [candidate division Zixibacteria bacterium]
MKAELIRDLAKEEVEQRLADSQEELFNLKLKMQVQKLDNPLRLRVLRRDIARLKTILHEHEKGIRSLSATTGKILDTGKEKSSEE